jgi:hypothetical protein
MRRRTEASVTPSRTLAVTVGTTAEAPGILQALTARARSVAAVAVAVTVARRSVATIAFARGERSGRTSIVASRKATWAARSRAEARSRSTIVAGR